MSPKLLNILLVLIPVILYYGVFDPLYTGNQGLIWTPESSIAGLQAKNVQYENTYNLISKVEKDMKKINNDYISIPEATTTKVMEMLPDEIDPVRLRNEVISIADKAGVPISGVKIAEDNRVGVPGVGAYTITFEVETKYKELKNLLEMYDKNTRFYNIDSLRITRADPKGLSAQELLLFDKEKLQAGISYKVYYLLK
jgi:hypothetical protein